MKSETVWTRDCLHKKKKKKVCEIGIVIGNQTTGLIQVIFLYVGQYEVSKSTTLQDFVVISN